MSRPKTPKVPQYNPADIIAADAQANRTNTNTPFGSTSWTNNGGRWTQDVSLSPEMQQILGRVFSQAGQGMGPFSYGGLDSTGWGGPVGQQGDHLVGRKQQAQNMNYAPPQGQGLSREGGFTPSSFQPGGGQFREGGFQGFGGLDMPDNAASARDAAGLFGEFVPKPDAFDPMKFAGVYDQMFGGRIYKG